jgi:glucan-binding YG repeat protein
MTKAGTYTFRVRTVPHSTDAKTYGKASDWVDSDEYYLDEDHVSDGSGKDEDGSGDGAGTGEAGWIKESGYWYYKYPNGSMKKDSWVKVNDIWYLFDTTGKMLTGWQTRSSGTYYLNDSGAMLEGLCQLSGKWYYLNPDPNNGPEGALVKSSLYTVNGETYYAGAKGERMTGWVKVNNHWSYFDPESGAMKRNTTVDTFYLDGDGVWVQN